jgi:hypothetical protein
MCKWIVYDSITVRVYVFKARNGSVKEEEAEGMAG